MNSSCAKRKYNVLPITPNNIVICWKCGKEYRRKETLLQHIRVIHLNKRLQCTLCSNRTEGFISQSTLNRHIKRKHTQKNMKIQKSPCSTSTANQNDECFSTTDPAPNDSSIFQNMSYEANEKIPSFANILSMRKNDTFGCHVIADCDIPVGKVVFVSKPFATVECLSSNDSSCFECGKSQNKDFVECPHCINVVFCSKKCCLSREHQLKCNKMFNKSDSNIVRLSTEMIKNAFNMAEDPEECIKIVKSVLFERKIDEHCKPPFSTYAELLSLKGIIEKDHTEMINRVVECLVSVPGIIKTETSDLKRILKHMASRHIATIRINSFSEIIPTGKGICNRYYMHDALSRVNHSCSPNIHHYFDDANMIRGVCVRPIKQGEQIFITYLGEMKFQSDIIRRMYITENWRFNCNCELCCTNIHDNQIEPSFGLITKQAMKKNEPISSSMIEECQKYLNKYGHSWSTAVQYAVSCLVFIIHKK